MEDNRKRYVYAILDPTISGDFQYSQYFFTNEPFYVGYGLIGRACVHFMHAKQHLSNMQKNSNYVLPSKNQKLCRMISLLKQSHEPIIHIVQELDSIEKCWELEKYLIKVIGRKIKNEGPLLNIQPGGNYVKEHLHKRKLSIDSMFDTVEKHRIEQKNKIDKKTLLVKKRSKEIRKDEKLWTFTRTSENVDKMKTCIKSNSVKTIVKNTITGEEHIFARAKHASDFLNIPYQHIFCYDKLYPSSEFEITLIREKCQKIKKNRPAYLQYIFYRNGVEVERCIGKIEAAYYCHLHGINSKIVFYEKRRGEEWLSPNGITWKCITEK